MNSEEKAGKNATYISFEVDGKCFAIEAAELSGVAQSCPLLVYPGLPSSVVAIVQWGGKIFPVLRLWFQVNLNACTFLFSDAELSDAHPAAALAIPGTVKVFFKEKFEADFQWPPSLAGIKTFIKGQIWDPQGSVAYVIDMRALLSPKQEKLSLAA